MNSVPWGVAKVVPAAPVVAALAVVVPVADPVRVRGVMGQPVDVVRKVPARAVRRVLVVLKGRGLDEAAQVVPVVVDRVDLVDLDKEGPHSPILTGCCHTRWNSMPTKTAS